MWDNTEHPADRDEYSDPMTRLDRVMLGSLLAVYVGACVLLAFKLFN